MLLDTTLPVTNLIIENHVITFLQQYSWVVLVVLIIDLISVGKTVLKKKRQKDEETDITNLFMDDGSKNEHLEHKEYDITTRLFIAFILVFVFIVLKTL